MARKAKTPIRDHQMVPVSVIDHLLDQLVENEGPPFTFMTEDEVMKAIGYVGRAAIRDWRASGKAPKRAQYALMGLLAEQQHKHNGSAPTPSEPEKQFTFDELTQIFMSLLTADRPRDAGAHARLQSKVAIEMNRYVNGG